MHVEGDATRGLAVDRDVEALDRRMPAPLVHDRRERHPEELAVEIEDRLPYASVLQVRTNVLRIEAETLRLHAVHVVEPFPFTDGRGAGVVEPLFLEQHGELGLR